MAKKQTRRTISVMGKTYRRLAIRCAREGRSVSGFLEDLIAPAIEGIEDPGPEAMKPKAIAEPTNDDPASGIFTF